MCIEYVLYARCWFMHEGYENTIVNSLCFQALAGKQKRGMNEPRVAPAETEACSRRQSFNICWGRMQTHRAPSPRREGLGEQGGETAEMAGRGFLAAGMALRKVVFVRRRGMSPELLVAHDEA